MEMIVWVNRGARLCYLADSSPSRKDISKILNNFPQLRISRIDDQVFVYHPQLLAGLQEQLNHQFKNLLFVNVSDSLDKPTVIVF